MFVAPFTGAWIEMRISAVAWTSPKRSHPSRVRGLKCFVVVINERDHDVAPFTGAWIEIG